jgi:hypothetical protein
MLLTTPDDMQIAMEKVRPRRIAVAYLGAGWRDYLSVETLDEIIVSPALGSNPWALADLLAEAERCGRPRVYFLEALHAKLYLGEAAALVGSANLTYNGLGGGLLEAGVLITDDATLQEAHRYLDTLRDQAVSDSATQQRMLAALKARWDRAHWHEALPNEAGKGAAPATLADWEPHQGRVHVTWYCEGEWAYNEAVMDKVLPEAERNAANDDATNAMTFLEGDDIQVGDWLLCWKSRTDGRPWKGKTVSWMQVQRLVSEGATAETQGDYTQVALEFPDYASAPEPFALTTEIQALVRDRLASGDYPELLGIADDWSMRAAWPTAQRFLASLKTEYLARHGGGMAS